jgi:hypothetical protein
MSHARLVRVLARAFVGGEQTADGIAARSTESLGRDWKWARRVAIRYLEAFSGDARPRLRDVIQFIRSDRSFRNAKRRFGHRLRVAEWLTEPQLMQPVAAAADWDLPRIETVGALCDWLWLDPSQLDWFADLKGLNRKGAQRLDHYYYRALMKPTGDIRLIEAPKKHLKRLQRQILAEILDRIPPHSAAHGFVKGRSIRSFAAPHVGKHVVLRMDLRDFFPGFRAGRIQTVFRAMGYPEPVADLLGGLCTNAVSRGTWRQLECAVSQEAMALYAAPHLPQGAPASPSFANICCYRLDCRLAGLAKSTGASYSRYADDLAFSGDEQFGRSASRFAAHVAAIVAEEGLAVNFRKTRVMRRGVRQHLAGMVVNEHLNVRRQDFDVLKAILTNCIRLGPGTQNREGHPNFKAHLEGRVAFVASVNQARGERLRQLLAQIRW